MPINIDFEGTDIGVVAWMRGKTDAWTQQMLNKANYLMLLLQQKIVGEKLSGQVLNQRSGTLAAAVEVVPAEVSGDVLSAGVVAGSGPAWYHAVHEYGPHTIVPVEKKWLHWEMNGKRFFAKQVTIPERKTIKPALDEMYDEIVEGMAEALR